MQVPGGRKIDGLLSTHRLGQGAGRRGITSVCSGHATVIEAALVEASEERAPILIEATCHQVNHRGGYTGMTPSEFGESVKSAARRLGVEQELVVLGGDHLGPGPWSEMPSAIAMREASAMIQAYASAGYEKLHLDASAGCADDPAVVPEPLVAARAAELAGIAERASLSVGIKPWYVIGSEVPTPGGRVGEEHEVGVTRPDAVLATVDEHRRAFEAAGLSAAFERVIAVVVHSGAEFGSNTVYRYRSEEALRLVGALQQLGGLVYEAHSTDYQFEADLGRMVQDGFAVLKVGPALTFALRQALYALDMIAWWLLPDWRSQSLAATLEDVMRERPQYWTGYYAGDAEEQRIQMHFSYSDRIRYYWSQESVRAKVDALISGFEPEGVPLTLVSQFFPQCYDRVAAGVISATPIALVREVVRDVLRQYSEASRV